MKASKQCIDLIKRFEGCKLSAYLCPAGVPTIGYGHTRGVKIGDNWTQEQADSKLLEEVEGFTQDVERLVRGTELEQCQFDALVSFAYNLGASNLQKSMLLATIRANNLNYTEIERQFLRWNKANGKVLEGLTKRRQAEANLYIHG